MPQQAMALAVETWKPEFDAKNSQEGEGRELVSHGMPVSFFFFFFALKIKNNIQNKQRDSFLTYMESGESEIQAWVVSVSGESNSLCF